MRDLALSLLLDETRSIDLAKHDAPFGDVFAWLTNANVSSDWSEVRANSHSKSKEAQTRVLVAVHLVAGTMVLATAAATPKFGAIIENRSNKKRGQVLSKQRRLGWIRHWPSIQDLYHRAHVRLSRM